MQQTELTQQEISKKCRLIIHHPDKDHGETQIYRIIWYRGSTAASILNAIKSTVGLPEECNFALYDLYSGIYIGTDPESLPDNVEVRLRIEKKQESFLEKMLEGVSIRSPDPRSRVVHRRAWFGSPTFTEIIDKLRFSSDVVLGLRRPSVTAFKEYSYIDPAEKEPLLPEGGGLIPALSLGLKRTGSDGGGSELVENLTDNERFRLNYLKLERINAHLANERTYLCWIRTALTLLSIFFSLYVSGAVSGAAFWFIGGVFGMVIPIICYTGYIRYHALYIFLEMSYSEMMPYIGKAGVQEAFFLMGVTLVIACTSYFFVAKEYHFMIPINAE
mmetsp:Transcript_10092/g.13156  ORF Transcript_10092/g.13156 Transcript_10092/m.13156 type:complete len:331 (+) Transcript_10092:16-1008(+)